MAELWQESSVDEADEEEGQGEGELEKKTATWGRRKKLIDHIAAGTVFSFVEAATAVANQHLFL